MTTLTDTQVITASGGLVELGYSQTTTGLNVTATTDSGANTLISNFTVVCDGSPVLVEAFIPAAYPDIAAANRDLMFTLFYDNAVQVSRWGLKNTNTTGYNVQPVSLQYRMTPTAGAHTFSLRAHVSTGTGRIDAGGSYGPAFLRVSKIVQATQWPAVTTGTIICTSSTRPSAPFEGQKIYETDTKKELTYNGSGWYAFNQCLGVANMTSTQSTTSTTMVAITASAITATVAANRLIRMTARLIPYYASNNWMNVAPWVGSTQQTLMNHPRTDAYVSSVGQSVLFSHVVSTTSASTSTFSWRFASPNGSQINLYGNPGESGQFTVEDIGPA